jgi:glutamate-1-semialdehyde 2,1-aminomutase
MKKNLKISRYRKSEEHLKRAEQTIPLGSQTFSKSRTQYPVGISPLYAVRAKGAKIWDIDGNVYVDLVSSLAAITLGYSEPEVDRAVKKQIRSGVSLSLPAKIESEVSELIVEMVPSAEMVRFGKNGSDATSAAIRLARAFTGRDHVIICGYHGWQDWSIGSTSRSKGVPELVSSLTHKFEYNDIESLRRCLDSLKDKVAAVILEPMNSAYPIPGFLKSVKDMAHEAGALLIFDETITGFRYAKGGAQELFGVTPDLSTFGKGMANGFPLSAVVGRRDVMMEMEEIFFSGTFGGELLSLAAAKVVLQRHLREDVCGALALAGQQLSDKVENVAVQSGLEDVLSFSGHPSWRFLKWSATERFTVEQIKTFFMQEMFKRGVLVLATHNTTLAHTPKINNKLHETYAEVLFELQHAIETDTLDNKLLAKPLQALFKIR